MAQEFLDIRPIPWNKDQISSKLQTVADGLSVETDASRPIADQLILIKTCGTPDLLERALVHHLDAISNTQAVSSVHLGVVDDSPDDHTRNINKSIIDSSADLLATKSPDLILEIRKYLLEEAASNDLSRKDKKELLLSLQILLTDRFSIHNADTQPDRIDKEYLERCYSSLGGGMNSTSNAMLILAANMLGRRNLSLESTIITLNDDDIIPASMELINGMPAIVRYDHLKEREIQFSDPKRKYTAGKYVGTPGNPFAVLTSAMETTSGILLSASLFNHDAPSPYYVINAANGTFASLSVAESIEKLPEIIDSFLNRTPITALRLPGPAGAKWIFDQGNLSLIGSEAAKLPFAVGGLTEFIQSGIIHAQNKTNVNRILTREEPILHIRGNKHETVEIYEGGKLLAGMTSRYVHDQALVEACLQHYPKQINEALMQYLPEFDLTAEGLLSSMPHLMDVKGTMLETITSLRDFLKTKINSVPIELATALERLIDEVNPERIDALVKNRARPQEDSPEVKNALKYIIYYIRAVSYWPRIFNAAYRVGLAEAQTRG